MGLGDLLRSIQSGYGSLAESDDPLKAALAGAIGGGLKGLSTGRIEDAVGGAAVGGLGGAISPDSIRDLYGRSKHGKDYIDDKNAALPKGTGASIEKVTLQPTGQPPIGPAPKLNLEPAAPPAVGNPLGDAGNPLSKPPGEDDDLMSKINKLFKSPMLYS